MPATDQEMRDIVRRKYAEIAKAGTGCCGPAKGGCGSTADAGFTMIGDAYDDVAGYVAAADLGLGCGLPVEHAGIVAGDSVLDLGSGAGLDAFVARRAVGETGTVIGVDMTPEMIARARANTTALGYANVEFRLAEIEHLPVDRETIGVVISNCVLNLVPDKAAAFAEIHRVLKPGGHFCISDIVTSQTLPDWATRIAELYAGCVTGAIAKTDYLRLIEETGFVEVAIRAERRIDVPSEVLRDYADETAIAAAEAIALYVTSITVTGRKPL